MTKVITYGTYDLLHYGHIKLLERAKALGDYLIVGVTADGFDQERGKINVKQSLMERVEAVKSTGLADEIIIEEYEGQKIDDIRRYEVDIFTVGSDWEGKFDYINEYCKVVYLPRTEGVSSSEIRAEARKIKVGFVGNTRSLVKYVKESQYVNGIEVGGICSGKKATDFVEPELKDKLVDAYEELLDRVDAVYIGSAPQCHYLQIKKALLAGKHVLCESPIAVNVEQIKTLNDLAKNQGCLLMDSLKTAYSTAFSRLILLVKSGRIGEVYSIDSTCTSLYVDEGSGWNSICEWGPTALLPIFNILGVDYKEKRIISHLSEDGNDAFTQINLVYNNAVAIAKVGKGVKSEGDLVISGTKGYIYVPAPWWKTDYFEIRYEDPNQNKRYFYQLDGEGIRYELVVFAKGIENNNVFAIDNDISKAFCSIVEDFYLKNDFVEI